VERVLNPDQAGPKAVPAIPPLRDDSLITATRKLNEALQELARAVGEDGSSNIAEQDRTNLAKFLTISRARMDNLVARLRSLAVTFFALLRSRGADLLIAFPLALGAFFFGFVLVTLVRRIVLGVAYLWRMRR